MQLTKFFLLILFACSIEAKQPNSPPQSASSGAVSEIESDISKKEQRMKHLREVVKSLESTNEDKHAEIIYVASLSFFEFLNKNYGEKTQSDELGKHLANPENYYLRLETKGDFLHVFFVPKQKENLSFFGGGATVIVNIKTKKVFQTIGAM